MGKKILRLPLSDVDIGDKLYAEFPDKKGGVKKGYIPITKKLDMGVGGICLGAEYDSEKEPIWIKVGSHIVTIVRELYE